MSRDTGEPNLSHNDSPKSETAKEPSRLRMRLEACRSLGRRGRMVTLGGSGQNFPVSAEQLLKYEQSVLGSRYVTRSEVIEALDLVARREVWPLVTDICPLEDAEALHARVERGEVIGRAAVMIR